MRVLSPWMALMVTKHARHRARSRRSCEKRPLARRHGPSQPQMPTDRASHGTIAPPSMNAAPFTLGGLFCVLAQDEMTPSRGPVACAAASTSSSPINRKTFRWLAVFVSMFAGTAHGFLLAPAAGGVVHMRRGGRGQGRFPVPRAVE